jgi:hypothetical protein
MKIVDDRRSEIAFNKAFSESIGVEQQLVKKTFSAIKKESIIEVKNEVEKEDLEDIEGLDFYNVTFEEKITFESNHLANTKEDKSTEFQKIESLNKEISKYELPNRAIKVLKGFKNNKISTVALNLEEPIKLSKVISKEIESTRWASVNIEITDYQNEGLIASNLGLEIKNNAKVSNLRVDRISTKLSSNERSVVKPLQVELVEKAKSKKIEVYLNKEEEKDDLVFFDYSETENNIKVKVEKKKTSTTITDLKSNPVITSKPQIKSTNNNKQKKSNKWDLSNFDSVIANLDKNDIKPEEEANISKNNLLDAIDKNQKRSSQKNQSAHSDYILQVYNAKSNKDLRDFDIRFNDDEDEIITDNGSGEVQITKKINNNNGIRRTTILSKGNIPTTIDIVLEDGETTASVPVFSREYYSEIMTSQNLRGDKAVLIVELDKKTEDVNIDAKYEAKLYFDKNLRIVNPSDSDYNYIMLVGIESGNTIVNFKRTDEKVISKIVHLEDEEIYYDPNFYFNLKNDEFDLIEEHLLSKSLGPLSLDVKELEGLTFDAKFKKLTINKYQASTTIYPVGTRSYIQLSHLSEPIYVGRWNNDIVKVPSESYMRYVLEQFQIGSVSSQCLVQINLSKSAKELYFNGLSSSRSMRVQAKILDKDGVFYTDLSSESEKIFLLGEEQGIINVQVRYADGTFDYLQSYCSDSTYLVEQL